MKPLKVYKIRNKEGLYSAGGRTPRFTKTGKTWSHIGYLKNHLGGRSELPKQYIGCEIVELEYRPVEGQKILLEPLFEDIAKQRKIKKLEASIKYKKDTLEETWRRRKSTADHLLAEIEKEEKELEQLKSAPEAS